MESTNQQKALQSIVMKAWEDHEFKQNLLADPKTTIENFLGYSLNLPVGKNLIVTDQTDANTVFINLPAEPEMEDVELNEDQLDMVSGGGNPIIVPPTTNIINNGDENVFNG